MEINILQEYTSLEEMSVKELLKEWPRYFDTPPKTKSNKKYLVNELIYRVQELAYGGLTKKTIDRLEALAESKGLNERKKPFWCGFCYYRNALERQRLLWTA